MRPIIIFDENFRNLIINDEELLQSCDNHGETY